MGRSLYWTLEDNMVDSLIFCATITNRSGAIPHLCKQQQKRPTPVRTWLSRIQAVSGSARYFVQWESITWCTSDCSLRLFPNNWKLDEAQVKILSSLFRRRLWPLRSHSGCDTACCSWQKATILRGWLGVKARSLVVHSNLSAFHRTSVIVVRTDELLSSG